MRKMLSFVVVFTALSVCASAIALANGSPVGEEGGSGEADQTLAESSTTIVTVINLDPSSGAGLDGLVEGRLPAVPPGEPHCAEWSNGSGDGAGLGSVSLADLERQAEEDAAREQELLDAAILAQGGTPVDSHATLKSIESTRPPQDSKPIKVASSRMRAQPVDDDFDWSVFFPPDDEAEVELINSVPSAPVCVLEYVCGAERVDDILFGGLAGEPDGAFAEYVSTIGSYIDYVKGLFWRSGEGPTDTVALADAIGKSHLGEQPTPTMMPVFYYCRRGPGGPFEIGDTDYSISMGWDVTVEDQYDLPAGRALLVNELRTVLDGNRPQMQTIPPVERGYTFVQLPMWLWVEDPKLEVHIENRNATQTARLETRAELIDVTWDIDGETQTCTLGDMKEFVNGDDHISDEPPVCMHMFTEVTDYRMTATARYRVEERVSYRGHDSFAWPDPPWYAHPTTPIATVDNQTDVMTAREILSVNVPIDLADG